ncbi:hypothetical protein ACWWJF_14465 [Symbiopectobacterium sp. Eva_TO]
MLRAILIDDEQLAREELLLLLDKEDDIEVIAQCSNALEAIPGFVE